MSIVLISAEPLQSNSALFENSEDEEQDLGDITWNNPYKVSGEWFVTFSGIDAAGTTIESTEIQITQADTINPTKVLWALVRLAREVLCPECSG